ncbi:MAG: hypothetical protein GY746_04130, partial [Gammaproteobacteria bacterium]|nr:hypothetical protein [Gammaproteobacteria bacterium]
MEHQTTDRKTHSHTGILMVGGAYVPLDPSYPAAHIMLIMEDAEFKALLVKDEGVLAKHRNIL